MTGSVGRLVAVAALCGAGVGMGLLFILLGLRGAPYPVSGWWARLRKAAGARDRVAARLATITGVGVVTGVVTGWPAGALLAAAGTGMLPHLLGKDRTHATRLARIEAIATWTEMLRDTLAAAAGLEQAITATAATAPEPIRGEVTELAARLHRGERLPAALRNFADQLDDPTADLVVAALVLACEHQARKLADLLGSLATAARDQAGMRMRIASGRARTRTSVRVIVACTVGMATGLVVLNRGYLTPYDGAAGQLVLLGVGGLFTVAFAWLAAMTRLPEPGRFLAQHHARAGYAWGKAGR